MYLPVAKITPTGHVNKSQGRPFRAPDPDTVITSGKDVSEGVAHDAHRDTSPDKRKDTLVGEKGRPRSDGDIKRVDRGARPAANLVLPWGDNTTTRTLTVILTLLYPSSLRR